MNEIFYAIFGYRVGSWFFGRLKYYNEGSPSLVHFNYEQVLKDNDKHGGLIGFYHTHPKFFNSYSAIDYSTMESWVDATGKVLICTILGINGYANWLCYNTQGTGGPQFIMNNGGNNFWKFGKFVFGRLTR